MTEYIRTTIAQPFPLFYGHVLNAGKHAPTDEWKGPIYDKNSETLRNYTPKEYAYAERQAAALRAHGWTVTVEVVERTYSDEYRVVDKTRLDQIEGATACAATPAS